MRVFVAGATGVIGTPLVRQLIAHGHQVVATTRSEAKLARLWNLGARPVVVDGLDAAAVGAAVANVEPDVIVHQMTSLAGSGDLKHFDRTFAATNRLRTVGTDNLLAAAQAVGVPRLIAQSFTGWPNERSGGPVKAETDPLDAEPPRQQRATLAAIRYLEQAVLAAPLAGVVLRYGLFYGPGASDELVALVRKGRLPIVGSGGGIWSMIHTEDAAAATVAAVARGHGVYNVVDDDPAPVREILPELASAVAARPPRHVPVWAARLIAGEVGVSMLTQVRGSSNAKAKHELEWTPRWASWREGFAGGLVEAADAVAG